ncbi:hypothetical protein [Malonomonas rubra]|uniref:hypothetical protein n=1 Tax=Malonomonas rubra TaxID=57040 RepID=UPI0026F2CAD3|nr:hypothetical protein [Malonomonas rubra]
MKISKQEPSEKSRQTLAALTEAVSRALEKKRRLGQYAVIWQNGKPIMVGEDAPQKTE